MKKILKSSRHVRMRGRPSCLVTLFPVKDPVILFFFFILVITPGLTHPTFAHLVPVDLTITSKIIPSTVIRI